MHRYLHDEFTAEECHILADRVRFAEKGLLDNCVQFPHFKYPILTAGDNYSGMWLEHNQDNVFLAKYMPESAWQSQEAFIRYQRDDGLLPFMMSWNRVMNPDHNPSSYWHLQTVFPFATAAYQIWEITNRGMDDLRGIYNTAVRYDEWLQANRNRLGTGLVEMYCEWDTGHDGSPRVTDGGIPHSCPEKEAANMPDLACMPILSVDLSAMLFGARRSIAGIAERLGEHEQALLWRKKADHTRNAMFEYLYDAEDDFFYDRAPQGFRRYRSEHITRVFMNHVLAQDEFDRIYERYFTIPGKGFLTDYPIPSMAVDDPHFVKGFPYNCWGSNSQALTVLRALFWMPFYGRENDLRAIYRRWLRAQLKYNNCFPQEINPFDGSSIGTCGHYSPAYIVFIEGVKRFLLEGQ